MILRGPRLALRRTASFMADGCLLVFFLELLAAVIVWLAIIFY